jgi:hypothetical protein
VATWLVERTGDEIAPAFLIMAAAAVTFVTLFTLRETYRAHSVLIRVPLPRSSWSLGLAVPPSLLALADEVIE